MIGSFFKAITAYATAIRLIRTLILGIYVLIPALLSLILAAGIVWLIFQYADDIGNWLTAWYNWKGEGVVDTIGAILSGVLVAVLAFMLFKYLILILVGPFLTPLSEAIEAHLIGKKATEGFRPVKFVSDVLRSIRIALRNIFWELVYTSLLLVASVVFPIFAPFAAGILFIIQAYYAGFGNMDYVLERHLNYRDSVQFVRQQPGLAIGNGIVFIALLFIGIGFLIAPPLSCAAATVATVEALEREKSLKAQ